MIRTLKSRGLAFVAMLAMSAVVASAAQAAPTFTGSGAANTATGSGFAGGETLTTGAGTLQCDSHFLLGAVGGGDFGSGGTSQVTVTPSYSGCTAFGFLNAQVHENSCDYVFTATEEVDFNVYNHHAKLDCPGTGGGMIITGATCEVKLPEAGNANWTTVQTTNLSGGTVTIEFKIANLTFNVLGDGFGCPFKGIGHTSGEYHGHVRVSRVGGGTVSVSGS